MTPQEYYHSLPTITKYWAIAVLGISLAASLGLGKPIGYYFHLDWTAVIKRFNVWRPLTTFLYLGPISFNWIFTFTLFVRHSKFVEEVSGFGSGGRGTAEYMWLLAFGSGIILALSYVLGNMYFLMTAIIFYIVHIWSRQDPHQQVEFYGFTFSAWHTPFLYVLLTLLMGGDLLQTIIGILVGHLWVFLRSVVPKVYGWNPLRTPDFVYKLVERKPILQPVRPSWASSGGHSLR